MADESPRENDPDDEKDCVAELDHDLVEKIIEIHRANLERLTADANVRIARAIRQRERSWTCSAT
jgi:hypothetical protein